VSSVAGPAGPAVRLEGVARRFTMPDGNVIAALEEFSLDVAPGEFCAIVGPTGCGKSTTLGLVAGLARPQAGSVELFGRPVAGIDRRIGFVFQQDALFPWRSVLGNVAAGPRFRGGRDADARARDWIARVGLEGFERSYPHQLSGGMRKRVALAQTFINQPDVLLMDEPFSALDAMMRVELQDLLLKLWADLGLTILFVTHDLDEALYLAQRVIMLSASPGTIAERTDVPLAYPRRQIETRSEPTYLELRERLYRNMVTQVMAGRADAP